MQDVEIKKLNKKVVEAIAFSAVESSNHGVTKEFFESTVYQVTTFYILGHRSSY